jgi:hypothetical protein
VLCPIETVGGTFFGQSAASFVFRRRIQKSLAPFLFLDIAEFSTPMMGWF